MDSAERLANKARKSISSFCMNECGSYCCKKGHITISEKELKAMENTTKRDESRIEILSTNAIRFSLEPHCPSLKDNKCMIHSSKRRPSICHEYPVFVRGNVVHFSYDCTAVMDNKMYPFMAKFILMGYDVRVDKKKAK